MPNINTAFPSKYLKEADLNGQQPHVVIARVVWEDVGQGAKTERKPVVYFEGKTKGLVVNKTNAQMIARISGTPETDDWAGTRIRLVSAEVEYQGQPVAAIRVREPLKAASNGKPAAPPPPPQREPGDEIAPDADDIGF